jgi:hypothetical protein
MDERLSGGRLNAYLPTHVRRRMSNPCEATLQAADIPGVPRPEFGFEGRRTSTKAFGYPVIQIFDTESTHLASTKAFGYSCYPDSDTESTHLASPRPSDTQVIQIPTESTHLERPNEIGTRKMF